MSTQQNPTEPPEEGHEQRRPHRADRRPEDRACRLGVDANARERADVGPACVREHRRRQVLQADEPEVQHVRQDDDGDEAEHGAPEGSVGFC